MDSFIERLWKTALGRDFNLFLNDTIGASDIFSRLDAMTNRLLADPQTALTRISIIQLLSEDAYRKGRLTNEAEKRLRLLEGRVSLTRLGVSQPPTRNLIAHGSLILVASLPFGSPAARQIFSQTGRNLLIRLGRIVGAGKAPLEYGTKWGVLLGREVFENYELKKALTIYLNAIGAYSFIYLFWYDYRHVPGGRIFTDRIHVYDYEDILEAAALY